jgi:hypothetical protein
MLDLTGATPPNGDTVFLARPQPWIEGTSLEMNSSVAAPARSDTRDPSRNAQRHEARGRAEGKAENGRAELDMALDVARNSDE